MSASFDDRDENIRPGDDLYQHVNGAWERVTEIPSDQASTGSFRVLRDNSEAAVHQILADLSSGGATQLRTLAPEATDHEIEVMTELYRRFMDVDAVDAAGTTPLRPYLTQIDAITDTDDLMAVLGAQHRQGVGGLFYLENESDPADPTHYVAWMGQSGLGLPDEAYYRDDDKAEIRTKYQAHVTRMLTLAGLDEPEARARSVVDLETRIASHHWDQVRTRDSRASFNPTTFDDLADARPGLHLRTWLTAAQIPAEAVHHVIDNQPSFFEGIERLLASSPIEQWRDWATWHVISDLAPFLPSEFVEANFDFYGRTLSGAQQLRERWKRAVGFVESAIGEAVGKLYVARHFPPAAKERMDELVANLLVDAVAAVSSFQLDRMIEKLSGPIDPDEWLMFPQTVNAYYHPLRNEIVFPAAILQPPFFDVTADDAVNYGGIGAVIGHEIGHGFDDQGSTYDGHGALRDWWSADDRAAFEERTKALISQYDALVPRQLQPDGPHVNGALTIGENIGDLGGVSIAYRALQISYQDAGGAPEPVDGLSWQQRFFLSYAAIWREKVRDEACRTQLATDPHSPTQFRCNQIVRNVDAFYDAFDVTPDDALWLDPSQRVSIW